MFLVPKVALLLETSTHYGRGLLRGIIRYSHLHGPWSLYIGGGDVEQGLPKIEFNAIIARVQSVRLVQDIKRMAIPTMVLEYGTEELALGNPLCGFSEVLTDSPKIAHVIADHLIGSGLKNFAYCGFANTPWSRARDRAFEQYLGEIGLPCIKHRINIHNWMRNADWTREWGRERDRLAAWLKLLARPTGLMACNDVCGRRVLEACAEAGVGVPAQLVVVGVDNDDVLCELCDPPLSSVALDLEKAGYKAAHLLDLLMSGRIGNCKYTVLVTPLRVVVRRSSEVIVKDDPVVGNALHFIEDYVGLGIGVSDVVGAMPVSRRTLERRFSRSIGRSILTEINCCRLDRAKRLLQETDLPVCRVATVAGFGNTRMFNRIFRCKENLSPSSFRRQLRGDETANRQAA